MNESAPYSVFAEFYDDVMSEIPYIEWVFYLQRLWDRHGITPSRVLDLACGTGNMTYLLAGLGMNVVGVDLSEDMLEVARSKMCGDLEQQVSFLRGDMCSFELKENMDLIICLFDSINYILESAELASVFAQVYKCLAADGWFLFDFNTEAGIRNIETENSVYKGEEYFCFWNNETDPQNYLWEARLTFYIKEQGDCWICKKEKHLERGYSRERISEELLIADFKEAYFYRAYTLKQVTGDYEPDRIFAVAKK